MAILRAALFCTDIEDNNGKPRFTVCASAKYGTALGLYIALEDIDRDSELAANFEEWSDDVPVGSTASLSGAPMTWKVESRSASWHRALEWIEVPEYLGLCRLALRVDGDVIGFVPLLILSPEPRAES